MCFNPTISLTTAIIEWLLALIMPWKYPQATTRKFMAIFLFTLGLYQFTEFMACRTNYWELWMRVGFIAYSFLPAMALHATLFYLKINFNRYLIYIIPFSVSLLAINASTFVETGVCHSIFVTARNTLFNIKSITGLIGFGIYIIYYFGLILVSCLLSYRAYLNEKNRQKRKILLALPLAVFLMCFPTFILTIIFPVFNVMFPSVLCHFALLMALVVFVGVRWEHEYNIKKTPPDDGKFLKI